MAHGNDHILSVIGICLAIFGVLAVLLVIGEYFGGSWSEVTVGIAPYIFVITCFGLAAYTLFYIIGRR